MAHLGSYLFHELTTPLGLRLDQCAGCSARPRRRRSAAWAPMACGSRAACCCGWRPDGRLLVTGWLGRPERDIPPAVCQTELDRRLCRSAGRARLGSRGAQQRIESQGPTWLGRAGGDAGRAVTRVLAGMEEQSQHAVAQEDPGAWAAGPAWRGWRRLGGGPRGPPLGERRAADPRPRTRADAWRRNGRVPRRRGSKADGASRRRVAAAEAIQARPGVFCYR